MYGKVVLITGATSGIGKAVAETLAGKGFRVYGTSRKPQPAPVVREGLEILQCDVRDEDAVKKTVDYIANKEGSIDILINNAGYTLSGAVEELSGNEVHDQFNTNFYGPHRMIRNVLPYMRDRKNGLIINISSVAGYFSVPYQSMYSASKYALEAMSEALRIEVKPFGIKVVLIEPGDVRTGFTNGRIYAAASRESKVYLDRMNKAVGSMIKSEQSAKGPDAVVKTVNRVIRLKNPPVRITVGLTYKVFALLKRLLPSRVVEFLVSMIY